jgi:hypothetical protein
VWCNKPERSEQSRRKVQQKSAIAAISEIPRHTSSTGPRRRLSSWAPASCALGIVLSLASEASAARVSLLGFEGDSATPLRWRVAQILKRAGHTVLGFSPPRNPDSASELRAYAERRRVDAFVSGSSVEGSDGWELSLTVRDAEGQSMGSQLTFTAASLGSLVKELKADGQDQLDRVVRGKPSGAGDAGDDDIDSAPAADLAGNLRASAARKKKKPKKTKARRAAKKSRPVEVTLDEEPAPEEPAPEPTPIELDPTTDEGAEPPPDMDAIEEPSSGSSKASSWSAGDKASDDDGSEDDAEASEEEPERPSLLSRELEASSEVGVDEASSDDDAAAGGDEDPTVVLGVNAGIVRRTLVYVDDLYGRLRAPSVNTWVYQLNAAVYPFAKPVKDRIGLIASYESVISGVVRDNAAGTDFAVTHSELFGGVRLRQPLGKHEVAVQAAVGTLAAGLDDPNRLSGVPEFDYTLLRSSLDVGLHFGPVSMRGSAGYRLSLGGYGQVSEVDWFPRMEGYGVEGLLGLQYRISKEVAFDVSGTMRRFVLTMNSLPEDAELGTSEVAGGAIDLYVSGYFGLNITL